MDLLPISSNPRLLLSSERIVSRARIPGALDLKQRTDVAINLDLTVCDREPIHIVGSVQPHGFLLVLRAASLTIVQASANAPRSAAVGASLDEALPQVGPILQRHLDEPSETRTARSISGPSRSAPAQSAQAYEVAAHRVEDLIVVEFEETDDVAGEGRRSMP